MIPQEGQAAPFHPIVQAQMRELPYLDTSGARHESHLEASNPRIVPRGSEECDTLLTAPVRPAVPGATGERAKRFPTQQLQPTREGEPILGSVNAWEGLVAAEAYNAEGWTTDIIITTPNAKWVPEIAVAHSEITTYDDGRWGRHEYSQWPQQFARDAFHIHCIPAKPRSDGPGRVLWRTLSSQDWQEDDCGVVGVGFLDRDLERQLAQEASDSMKRFQDLRSSQMDHKGWNDIGDFLVICLRHALDRLRCLPAVPGVIISLAAHVQRLTLELFGLVEWLGKVFKRVKTKLDCRLLILDVLGAHTSDASVAQMLHRAGIPVWLQQPFSTRLVVYEVVQAKDVPVEFSKVPSYPRLVLAKRDLSGALNLPGEWQRAMATIVRRQLCDARLPALLEAERDGALPPAKRLREGAVFLHQDSATVGPAAPTFVVQNTRDAKSLGHDLPVAPSTSASGPKQPSRRTRARHTKNALLAAASVDHPTDPALRHRKNSMNPFRQFYSSQNPRASVKYFFAPSWLLDALIDFDINPKKTARYLHHWISIRAFCRIRLFNKTIAGRPLTVSEWRNALWGDYEITEQVESSARPKVGRWKVRQDLQTNIRRLFGEGQSLPSYRVESLPVFGKCVVTHVAAMSDHALQCRVVWEAHETNWRCELLALDALMVGSNGWAELPRWMRESLVSRTWGLGTSGLDVVPPLDKEGPWMFCWLAPPDEGWESSWPHLSAFVELLGRWPACPGEVRGAHDKVLHCGADEFNSILEAAVAFYTRTFISKYDRLPVPPVHPSPFPAA